MRIGTAAGWSSARFSGTLQAQGASKGLKTGGKNEQHRMDYPVRGAKTGRLLSVRDAGIYLGISTWAVRELVWSGKLPCVRLGSRKIWLDRKDLDELVERQKEWFV